MKTFLASMLIAVAIVGFAAGGAAVTNAETSDGEYPSIVERIAEQFGLAEDEVQEFFDDLHEERQEEREAQMEERLDQAVEDGIITEDQRDALETKMAEMEDEREAIKDIEDSEERKEAMDELREEMEEWAEDNGIDLSALRPDSKGSDQRGGHNGGFGQKFAS